MGARWDHHDYWPDVDYSRPPAKPRVDWPTTLLRVGVYIILPFVVWTIIIALIWWGLR